MPWTSGRRICPRTRIRRSARAPCREPTPTRRTCCGRSAAWPPSTSSRPGTGTNITRSRCRSTAASAYNAGNQGNGRYDLTYSYQTNGASVNLTGSPDYAARIRFVGDPGSGCSDNQYAQFNTKAVTGPTYGSVGLESGRFLLGGCPDHTVDLAIARNIRFGGNRNLQFRLDVFNAFNAVIVNDRERNVQYRSPTDLTIVNSQTLADGSLDPA